MQFCVCPDCFSAVQVRVMRGRGVGGSVHNLIVFDLRRVYLQDGLLIRISLYICGFPLQYRAFMKPVNVTFFSPLNAYDCLLSWSWSTHC